MMFSKLKWFVEKKEGPVVDCVISVPGAYTVEQRNAIIDSANIAGLNVLGLVNENTAGSLFIIEDNLHIHILYSCAELRNDT